MHALFNPIQERKSSPKHPRTRRGIRFDEKERRRQGEALLRELALVLDATRRVRHAILQGEAIPAPGSKATPD